MNEESQPHLQRHWGKLHVVSALEELRAAIIAVARDIRKGHCGLKRDWRQMLLSSPMEFELISFRQEFWRSAELRELSEAQAQAQQLTFARSSGQQR